jgi:hypothetical protein
MMSKVDDIKVGVPNTHAGGLGQSPPPGDMDTSEAPTLRGSNVDELTSELMVLKLKKLKRKKMKIQEVSSSSSSNEEGSVSSSDNKSIQEKKDKGKRKNGDKPSNNTTSFNYDSMPSNHSFTSVHVGKPPRFDGMNYAKWRHAMKVHLMSLNLSVWKVVYASVNFLKDDETLDYNQIQQMHYNAKAINVLPSSLER